MWPFKPRPLNITLHASDVVRTKPGDVLVIGLPSDWSPSMLRQFTDFADEKLTPRLPAGVLLIFVPAATEALVLHVSPERAGNPKDGGGDAE
jgi:hypothetical protein